MHRRAGVPTAAAILTAGLCSITVPAAQNAEVSPVKLAEEARAAIPRSDALARIHALVTLHSALRDLDTAQANAVLTAAADHAERLSEGDSLGTSLFKAAFRGAVGGVAAAFFGWPWWMSPPFPVPGTGIDDRNEARAIKARLSLLVVQSLAAADARRAFTLAASIDVPHVRARAFEATLRAWPTDTRVPTELIREQARIAHQQQHAVVLAGLARGAAVSDRTLALELMRQSLEVWRSPQSRRSPVDSYTFDAAAELDSQSVEQEVVRLIDQYARGNRDAIEDALVIVAAGSAHTAPHLAWRALAAAQLDDAGDKKRLMRQSAVLREFPAAATRDHRADVEALAVDLLRKASTERRTRISFGPNGDAVVAGINAVSVLTRLNPAAAKQHADDTRFSRMVTLMILKQGRLGSAGQFPNQLMHLERALTLLDSNPRESLQVFESLDQSFWRRWTRVAVRDRSGEGSFVSYSGIMLRLTEQLDTIKTAWPDTARQVCATDAELCLRMLRRFGQVAEWIDAEAVEWLADDNDQRGEWVQYQPLTLTRAAEALSPIDREAADHAIQRGLALILTAPTPAREFALAANAVRWKQVDSASSGKAVTEALSRIQRLRERGVGRGWWPWIPQLLEWTAWVDVDTALALARDTDMSIRAAALASVASVLSSR